ncbi:hypothetical protein SSAG_00174 [Streptomyces sp. Mg1]|nr:hypothetical protein SSAG_00174 [Streptomyces sp. Mg1]
MEVGEGPFDDPAVGAEAGAVRDAASGDDRLDAQGPGEAPVLVAVVASVTGHRSPCRAAGAVGRACHGPAGRPGGAG